jgi:hypothetical protein
MQSFLQYGKIQTTMTFCDEVALADPPALRAQVRFRPQ